MANVYLEEQKRATSHDEEEIVAPFDEQQQLQRLQNQLDLSELEDYTASPPPPSPPGDHIDGPPSNPPGNHISDGNNSLVGNEPNILERSFMKQNEDLPPVTPTQTPVQLPKRSGDGQQDQQQQREVEYESPSSPQRNAGTNENEDGSIMDADVHVIGPAATNSTAESSPSTVALSSSPSGTFTSPSGSGPSTGNAPTASTNRSVGNSKGKNLEGKTKASPNDGGNKRCTSKLIGVGCCFLILVAIGIAVGVTMGMKGKNGKQNNSATGSNGGNGSPSSPDDLPTGPPVTVVPTPTPLVRNDKCMGAISIPNKDFELTASTSDGATTEGEVDFADIETTCGGRVGDGPGLWYSMVGGGREVTVSTCGEETLFDTKIAIYSGDCGTTGDSSSLSCVAEDDDTCGIASTVTWFAAEGELYYILIRGFREGSGTFQLIVKDPPPPNDMCTGAILLEPDGSVYVGNSASATVDYEYDGLCGGFDSLDITAPSVWFRVVGTGSELIATTCHGSEYDTKLSVFRGSNCENLVCVDGNDDACSGVSSQVEFLTVEGEDYYILIHGYSDNAGVYGISVATEDTLYNNFCWESKELKLGVPLTGSTLMADFDFGNVVTCGETLIVGPSVWYTVYGTGSDMMVSLCGPNTDYDTQVTVFTGGCSSLQCVGGNDDSPDAACDVASEYVWPTVLFEKYNIVVHGFGNSTGNFEVVVESLGEPPVLDSCSNALGPLPLNWDPVIGNTAAEATVSENLLDCVVGLPSAQGGSPLTVEGEWYYVESDGGYLNVSACENSVRGTRLAVFQGGDGDDCSNLSCGIAGTRHNACSFSWDSTRGVGYHFLVYSAFNPNMQPGEYSVTVTSTGPPLPVNSECEEAIELVIDAEAPVLGTTAGATEEDSDFCGVEITSPAVWYTVVGDGRSLNATLCDDNTTYDSKISVFTGPCGNIDCVGGDDDYCELRSSFTWEAEDSVRYYILVHGFAESTGDHGIRVVYSYPEE